MSLRGRLLVFGYPLLEVATAYAIAVWIGWGWMFLLVLLGFPVGFAIMRHAGNAALRDLQRSAASGVEVDSGRHALTFVGGLLVLIPGFWSDLVGLLLVLPPVQRLVRRRSRGWIESRVTTVRMPGVRYPGGEVIQGTVIRPDPTRSPTAPGESGSAPTGDPRPPRELG